MSGYAHRLLVITTALSQVKSRYPHKGANPNRIFQSLIAPLAGLEVLSLCAENHPLGEEAVASCLYQVHRDAALAKSSRRWPGRFRPEWRKRQSGRGRSALTTDERHRWHG
jgi:hypothetical protein